MSVVEDTTHSDRTDPGLNRSADSAAERLRKAVEGAGGAAKVSRRSRVPPSNLYRLLSGHEPKLGALTALADATGVRIEWLATGRGPMRADAQESIPPSPPATAAMRPHPLSDPRRIDHLAAALTSAAPILEANAGRLSNPRRFAQLLLLLYDEIAAAQEKSPSSPESD